MPNMIFTIRISYLLLKLTSEVNSVRPRVGVEILRRVSCERIVVLCLIILVVLRLLVLLLVLWLVLVILRLRSDLVRELGLLMEDLVLLSFLRESLRGLVEKTGLLGEKWTRAESR